MYLRTASATVCLLDGFVLRTLHPDILQHDNRIAQTVQSHRTVHRNTRAVVSVFPRMSQDTHCSSQTSTHVLGESQIMRHQTEQMLMRRIVPATPEAQASHY